jgi:hypothetical protein
MRRPSTPYLYALALLFSVALTAPDQLTFTATATIDSNPNCHGTSGDLQYSIHEANVSALAASAGIINFNLPANSTTAAALAGCRWRRRFA